MLVVQLCQIGKLLITHIPLAYLLALHDWNGFILLSTS